MVKLGVVYGLVWAASLALASPHPAPLVGIRTRNLPGTSDEDTLHAVWRRLAALAHGKRETVLRNSTSIDKSWNDATLFSYIRTAEANTSAGAVEAGVSIDITCATCYLKGGATAQLTINGTFDLGNTIKNVTAQLARELKNLTETALDSLPKVFAELDDELWDGFVPGGDEFELHKAVNFNNLKVDTDIDIDLPPLPAVQILFQIDNLDLYMEIDTTIAAGATLTIPLYKSQTQFGVSSGDDLEIGLFVTMDLILSVEGEISLRSGFHLVLDDPVGFNIALFGTDVSKLIFNGAKFEFLPVTLMKGEIALKATLRVGMHAGLAITAEPLRKTVPEKLPFNLTETFNKMNKFSAGVEVGVFAHVAEFLTNVTGGALLAAEQGCAVKIVQEYTLAVGAAAGATIALGEHTWGPQPKTTIPVFYTTLANICAATAAAKTTPASTTLAPRQAADPKLETQTITTWAFYTGVACANPAEFNCPQAQQTTTILTSTLTLVTAVPSGVKATFPPSTALTVPTTIPFGKHVKAISATTGVPVSYVPPPPPPPPPTSSDTPSAGGGNILDDVGEVFNGETGGVSNKLIIGLSVGLGVPILAAVIGGLVQWLRRRRYAPVPKLDTAVEYTGGYQSPMAAEREGMIKKGPVVSVGVAH